MNAQYSIDSLETFRLGGVEQWVLMRGRDRANLVLLLQGRHDYVAPPAVAERYYHALHAAAGKQLIWFDHSAHMPQCEEPARFRATLRAVKQPSAAPDRLLAPAI